jgi:hypothetical protein
VLTILGIFPEALEMLKKKQHLLEWVVSSLRRHPLLTSASFMTDKFMPLSQAVEGYDIFNKMQVQKVVFVPEHQ